MKYFKCRVAKPLKRLLKFFLMKSTFKKNGPLNQNHRQSSLQQSWAFKRAEYRCLGYTARINLILLFKDFSKRFSLNLEKENIERILSSHLLWSSSFVPKQVTSLRDLNLSSNFSSSILNGLDRRKGLSKCSIFL